MNIIYYDKVRIASNVCLDRPTLRKARTARYTTTGSLVVFLPRPDADWIGSESCESPAKCER